MSSARPASAVRLLRHPGGAAIVPIHYTMDPEKDPNWARIMRSKAANAEDWEKEMEINFLSVSGSRAFTSFSLLRNTGETKYDPALPLCLSCDFNVSPMAWIIAQVQAGEHLKVLGEIYMRDGSTEEAADLFLNEYGDHVGELWVFGDQTGTNRGQGNQQSNYQILRLACQGRSFKVHIKVPAKNPSNVNGVAAVNRRLSDNFGASRLTIDNVRCPELTKDLVQCVWEDSIHGSGKKLKKVRKREDPFFWRGHLVDALMYLVHRLWPVRQELSRMDQEQRDYKEFMKRRHVRNQRRKLIGEFPMPSRNKRRGRRG
jgi:hypothetical protein